MTHEISPESANNYYERLAPTAVGVAYQRTFTDIPYAGDIYAALETVFRENGEDLEIVYFPVITPMFEARHKMMDLLLREQQADQILEIAAGYASHSLIMTENPNIRYVEMDLASVIEKKRRILQKLVSARVIDPRPNLLFTEGNALSLNDVTSCTHAFQGKPVHIINEGLLRYLSHMEKAKVAANVKHVLQKYGGAWCTPDIAARGVMANDVCRQIMHEQNAETLAVTGVDVRENYFADEKEAQAFYKNLGFSIERRSFTEVLGDLVSPERERLTKQQVADAIGNASMYVMRVTE